MEQVRSQGEIDNLMNRVLDQMDKGTKFFGMSYEEGINAAINWLFNEDEPNPMDD